MIAIDRGRRAEWEAARAAKIRKLRLFSHTASKDNQAFSGPFKFSKVLRHDYGDEELVIDTVAL